jgi:hypothetical protein
MDVQTPEYASVHSSSCDLRADVVRLAAPKLSKNTGESCLKRVSEAVKTALFTSRTFFKPEMSIYCCGNTSEFEEFYNFTYPLQV